MNRLLAFGLLFVLVGCQDNEHAGPSEEREIEPIQTDRVIDQHGEIENLELFQQFLKETAENKQTSLEMTRYTIEGAPIYWKVGFQEGQYNIVVDNREDNFGSKNIESYQCDELSKDVTGSLTDYNFKSCDGGFEINLLSVISE